MFEILKTIRQIKRLRKKSVDQGFLTMFRTELETFVDANPAGELSKAKFSFADLFRMKAVQVPLAAFGIIILTGAGLAGASQRSLPGEKLFAVKVFTEDARAALSLSQKSKAELQASFAEKRISEIKEILEHKGIEAPGLDVALSRLEDNSKKAEAIIEQEKEKGGNLENELKQKAWEGFKGGADNINAALNVKKEELGKQEEELKIKIQTEASDTSAQVALQSQMQEIKKRQEHLKSEKSRIRSILEQSQQRMRLEIKIEFDDDDDQRGQLEGNNSDRDGQEVKGVQNKKEIDSLKQQNKKIQRNEPNNQQSEQRNQIIQNTNNQQPKLDNEGDKKSQSDNEDEESVPQNQTPPQNNFNPNPVLGQPENSNNQQQQPKPDPENENNVPHSDEIDNDRDSNDGDSEENDQDRDNGERDGERDGDNERDSEEND